MLGLVWFREDLRTQDNLALFHAAKSCARGVVGIYIIDASAWQSHHMAACRIEFLLRGVVELSIELAKLHIPLMVAEVKSTADISALLLKKINEIHAQGLFFNRQYEVNEKKRDAAVEKYLSQHDIKCYSYDDPVILPPGSIVTHEGNPYKVFTAFKHAWQHAYPAAQIRLLSPSKQAPDLMLAIPQLVLPFEKFSSPIDSALWPAGEKVAKRHLQHFIQHTLFSYDQTRDYPAIEGTSRLSPYLATGMISPRQCFLAALAANQGELTTGNKGALTWMSELIWREFYKHILVAYPRVSMHLPYRLETKKIDWRYNEKQWLAWQHGNTGYPIVDAAMRQLNTTGWMHNRLRMIVAMFFTKNLFFDWRLGEQYFIEHLIDGDLAANNGGWQWCASTGTDAAPYFRVFNTVTQSERFDEKGKFIRRYCPELTSLSDDTIHDPHGRAPLLVQKLHYPASIVNLALSRKHAIETFKYLSTNANQ